MDFKAFIKTLRKQKGITIREICVALDISQSTLQRLEDGRLTDPHPNTLKKLAGVLNTDYAHLMRLCGYLDAAESPKVGVQQVPFVPWAMLPGLHHLSTDELAHLSKETLPSSLKVSPLIALRLIEKHWMPTYVPGDVVILQQGQTYKDKDTLLLLAKVLPDPKPALATFKRVRVFGDAAYLLPMTPLEEGPDLLLTPALEAGIVGRVVELRRRV
ncbi:MAG: helix-turn-helix domain-containing protein [Candidatus Margulisiibacteriota bacterium]